MFNGPVSSILAGILGTQEIIILLILAVPVIIIVRVVSFIKNRDAQKSNAAGITVADEIEKLFALKEKGAISQQEFDNRKTTLLK